MGNYIKEHLQRMTEENTEFEKAQGEADSDFMFFPRTTRHQPKHILY